MNTYNERIIIARAKITNASIEFDGDKLVCGLDIDSTEGYTYFTIDIGNNNNLKQLMNILNIMNFKDIKDKPCIVVIKDRVVKDIGQLLWKDNSDLYDKGRQDDAYRLTIIHDFVFGYLKGFGNDIDLIFK